MSRLTGVGGSAAVVVRSFVVGGSAAVVVGSGVVVLSERMSANFNYNLV